MAVKNTIIIRLWIKMSDESVCNLKFNWAMQEGRWLKKIKPVLKVVSQHYRPTLMSELWETEKT